MNYICKNNPSRMFVHSQYAAQKMKFSIKDFFSKCDQIRMKLQIWSHLPKKPLMENFIFCAVMRVWNAKVWNTYEALHESQTLVTKLFQKSKQKNKREIWRKSKTLKHTKEKQIRNKPNSQTTIVETMLNVLANVLLKSWLFRYGL